MFFVLAAGAAGDWASAPLRLPTDRSGMLWDLVGPFSETWREPFVSIRGRDGDAVTFLMTADEFVAELGSSGLSAVLRIELLDSEAREALVSLLGNDILEEPESTAHVYVSAGGGGAALKNHSDPYDVGVSQLAGAKEWLRCSPERLRSPFIVSKLDECEQYSASEMGVILDEARGDCVVETVRAGDSFVVPRRVVHSARSLGEPSVHLSVSRGRRRRRLDVLDACEQSGLATNECSCDAASSSDTCDLEGTEGAPCPPGTYSPTGYYEARSAESCDDDCDESCDASCDESCRDDCTTSCDAGCTSSCDAGGIWSCDEDCTQSCDSGCATNCDRSCDEDCDDDCSGGCDQCGGCYACPRNTWTSEPGSTFCVACDTATMACADACEEPVPSPTPRTQSPTDASGSSGGSSGSSTIYSESKKKKKTRHSATWSLVLVIFSIVLLVLLACGLFACGIVYGRRRQQGCRFEAASVDVGPTIEFELPNDSLPLKPAP
ncbi:hypothetical protein CTAYLR_009326 [Chrysophaeum taylorii]|uniref:Bifunctional lysine-specific demethylase and histidyl-hydroxylase n=1 Tax=Chrysophaeum taylorii TaxID=2483200 RepID=A0AAD7UHL0_9STRA|nr:hypothetical protein CTAYLR_009326 [Chrysophaeum taylorii]